MSRLLALLAGLVAVVLVPLALSGPTALLIVPGHGLLTLLVCGGAFVDGGAGRPERARRWGLAYLTASAVIVGSLEIGGIAHGQRVSYWGVPWVAVLVWGWVPPFVAGVMGVVAEFRLRRRRVPQA